MAFGPSAGGGAAGGAASGAAAGMVFGPWGAVIGGIAGGILGAVNAGSQNKAQQKAARIGQQSENLGIVQARLRAMDQGYVLGQQSAADLAELRNLPTFARGPALTAVVGQLAQDRSLDQQNLDAEVSYETRAREINKANIRAGANAQMVSPFMSAASGALSLASTGYGLANGLDNYNRLSDIQANMAAAKTPQQAAAIAAGVPVSELGTVDLVTATNRELARLAEQTARQQTIQAGLSFGASLFNRNRSR